jgi:hypothetical protein
MINTPPISSLLMQPKRRFEKASGIESAPAAIKAWASGLREGLGRAQDPCSSSKKGLAAASVRKTCIVSFSRGGPNPVPSRSPDALGGRALNPALARGRWNHPVALCVVPPRISCRRHWLFGVVQGSPIVFVSRADDVKLHFSWMCSLSYVRRTVDSLRRTKA